MLRVFKNSRSGRYYAEYEIGGRKRQFSCKSKSLREAQRYADEEYLRRLSGGPVRRPTSHSLSEFSREFLSVAIGRYRPKTVESFKYCFRAIIRSMGDIPMVEIDSMKVERFIYNGQVSQYTAHKHYRTLRVAFEKAVAWKWIERNPFKEISKPRLSEVEADYLTEEELEHLLNAIDAFTFVGQRLRNCIILAFETGMRLGEIRHLRIEQINLVDRCIDVTNTRSWKTKNGRNRRVPLTQRALVSINEQLVARDSQPIAVRESPYLFPSTSGGVLDESHASGGFKKVVRSVFPDRVLHFHSLRHSMAHRAFRLNVPVFETQQILGHSTVALTERYGAYQRKHFPHYLRACDTSSDG
jgi:integrase